MTLKELNKAVCGLVKRAAEASGLGAELMAEDLSAPIQRPSLKVELEEDRDARAIRHRVEQAITFRVYFFAADQYRPKLDNLAMRQTLAEVFRDGVPVGEETVPIDEDYYQRVRRASFGSNLRGLNSFENIAVTLTEGYFHGYDPFRFPQVFDSITKEDVAAFLRRNLTAERAVLSEIVPREN